MEKTGESNIHIHNVSKKRRRFIKVLEFDGSLTKKIASLSWAITLIFLVKGHVHNDGGHEMALYIALIHSKVKTSYSWRIFSLQTKKDMFLTHPHFSFFVSWILFAIVWFVCLSITIPSFEHLYRYLISYVHGDFLYYQLQDNDAWVRWQNVWLRLQPDTLNNFFLIFRRKRLVRTSNLVFLQWKKAGHQAFSWVWKLNTLLGETKA